MQFVGAGSGIGDRGVPGPVVARLPELLRVLDAAAERGEHTLSSEEISSRLDASSAMIRKDLSALGFGGTRGVGYDVQALRWQVTEVLGLSTERPVVLVGAGHLGRALAAYPGFQQRGFRIVAVLDRDPALIGQAVGAGSQLTIADAATLAQVVAEHAARIAILAVPAGAAERVAAELVEAGVVSILTFAPVALSLPPHVAVRRADLAAELQILAFHESRVMA